MDINQILIDREASEPSAENTAKIRPYLRGPIQWDWLIRAIGSSGSALEVGLVLWYRRSLNKSGTFKVGINDLAEFLDCSWHTARRGLEALVDCGLIRLEKAPGQKHVVTLLDLQDEERDAK